MREPEKPGDNEAILAQAIVYADEASPQASEDLDWHTILRTGFLGGAKWQREQEKSAYDKAVAALNDINDKCEAAGIDMIQRIVAEHLRKLGEIK